MKRIPLLFAALAASWLLPARAPALDLVGTWHVLVHYKDSAAHNQDAERWEDRVWVFERDGERLRWIDYPIVVFSDESGRFEKLGGNRASRTLTYWTPNAAQQAELASGPTVNSRGSKSKELRGSDAAGWKTATSQQRSVSFVTYEEHWSIEGMPDKPSFVRTDVLGGGGGDDAEGRTLYKTTQVAADGKSLQGDFDRDGTRKGTFVLTRVGDVKKLSTEGPTPNEKQADRVRQEMIRQGVEGLGGDEDVEGEE